MGGCGGNRRRSCVGESGCAVHGNRVGVCGEYRVLGSGSVGFVGGGGEWVGGSVSCSASQSVGQLVNQLVSRSVSTVGRSVGVVEMVRVCGCRTVETGHVFLCGVWCAVQCEGRRHRREVKIRAQTPHSMALHCGWFSRVE